MGAGLVVDRLQVLSVGVSYGEGHVSRRRCEAAMAGGMKVAVSPAVVVGPWVWGSGGGGAMRLLLIFSGCLVCSGIAGQQLPRGGCRGGYI